MAGRPGASVGARGEELAAEFLRRAGYVVVARNLRTRHAEFDLIVRRGRLFVAVEVKTRTRHRAPERTVDGEQFERLERALSALAPSLEPRPRELRVDVVAVRFAPGEAAGERSVRIAEEDRVRHFEGQPFAPPKSH